MKMAVVFWHVKIHMALIHVESMGQQETEERHYEVVYSPKDTSPPRVILQSIVKKNSVTDTKDLIQELELDEPQNRYELGVNQSARTDPAADLIQRTLQNVLSIIGTGGGKSLTFMLPAALARKPTIVVSPTRSLIEDLHD